MTSQLRKRTAAVVACVSAALLSTMQADTGWAQAPAYLAANLEREQDPDVSSDPRLVAEVGSLVYFTADDRLHGRELWRTNGRADGTIFIGDVAPGPAGSGAQPIGALGDALYFLTRAGDERQLWRTAGNAGDAVSIYRFAGAGIGGFVAGVRFGGLIVFTFGDGRWWRTDGTAAGTYAISGSDFQCPAELDGRLYFHREGLWVTDGTPAGTRAVADSPRPTDCIGVVGDKLLFTAETPDLGHELWVSDGTAAGTHVLRDIVEGYGDAFDYGAIDPLISADLLYFAALDGGLWRTDGTVSGTFRLGGVPRAYDSASPHLTELDGRVFYLGTDGVHGVELWSTDGTTEGTSLVRDVNPGYRNAFAYDADLDYLPYFVAAEPLLYFVATDGVHGYELWQTDGTAEGTVLVEDLAPGPADFFPVRCCDDVFFGALPGRIVFSASDRGLWMADGTGTATRLLSPSEARFPGQGFAADTSLFFVATSDDLGQELWRTDGTAAGTTVVKDIRAGAAGSDPILRRFKDGLLYFLANDGGGRELWRSDGTDAGTFVLRDIADVERGLSPRYLTPHDRSLFFTGTTRDGAAVFRTDDTGETRAIAGPFDDRFFGGEPRNLASIGSNVFFAANDRVHGQEPWISDGSAGGPRLLADIFPGRRGSEPTSFTDFGGVAFFLADGVVFRSDATTPGTYPITADLGLYAFHLALAGETLFIGGYGDGSDLWRSDGTVAGTAPASMLPCCGVGLLTVVRGGVFFPAHDPALGNELWRSDGTERGTELVRDIKPGPDSALCGGIAQFPPDLTASGDRVYFVADDGVHGQELWVSDGSEEGTRLVADVEPGSDGSFVCADFQRGYPSALTNVGGRIFFVAARTDVGSELWVTDPDGGAVLVKDIRPGPVGSEPRELANANGVLLFSADDGVAGREAWRSDGTEEGTFRVADIAAGALSSNAGEFRVAGAEVYFAADDQHSGRELWAVPLSAIGGHTPTAVPSPTPTAVDTPSSTPSPTASTSPTTVAVPASGCHVAGAGRASFPVAALAGFLGWARARIRRRAAPRRN